MVALETGAAQFQSVDQLPAAGRPLQAPDLQLGTPAALAQAFAGGAAAQPHHLGAEPAGPWRQLHPAGLLKQAIGKQHQLLGQPLEIGACGQLKLQLLLGPAPLGRLAAATHGAIHLLGRHAGQQHPATGLQGRADPDPIAPHQAAGGVEQGQFAAAIGLLEGPLDLQG